MQGMVDPAKALREAEARREAENESLAKRVREARKERALALKEEMRLLSKHRKRIQNRLRDDRDWPMLAGGGRADIDPDDVRAPLPEDLKLPIGEVDDRMQELRAAADAIPSFAGAVVDPGVQQRRWRDHQEETARIAAVRGEAWTVELVEARIEEAFRTLARASGGRTGPREFGNAMPAPIRAYADLVNQAGNKSLRRGLERLARREGPPTGPEVRRMDEALMWSTAYLREEHPDLAMFANLGGMWKAWGAKVSHRCRELGIHRQVFYRDRKKALELIVERLKREGKAPT